MSWITGVFIVGGLSFIFTLAAIKRLVDVKWQVLTVAICPVFLSVLTLGLPSLMHSTSEHGGWASMFIVSWSIVGYLGVLGGVCVAMFFCRMKIAS